MIVLSKLDAFTTRTHRYTHTNKTQEEGGNARRTACVGVRNGYPQLVRLKDHHVSLERVFRYLDCCRFCFPTSSLRVACLFLPLPRLTHYILARAHRNTTSERDRPRGTIHRCATYMLLCTAVIAPALLPMCWHFFFCFFPCFRLFMFCLPQPQNKKGHESLKNMRQGRTTLILSLRTHPKALSALGEENEGMRMYFPSMVGKAVTLLLAGTWDGTRDHPRYYVVGLFVGFHRFQPGA